MTVSAPPAPAERHEPASIQPSKRTKVWRSMWMIAGFIAAVGVVISLVRPTSTNANPERRRSHSFDAPTDLVAVTGPRQILVKPDCPLAKTLRVVTVKEQTVTYPLLTVTGSVVARIRPGDEPTDERWQFASAEIAGNYADWLKTKSDIEFNRSQLQSTRDLTDAQIKRHEENVKRLRPLGAEAKIPRKDLITAEADLVQAQLQGQKDVFAAETALRTAIRQRSALERQLNQAGIEPAVFARARDGMVLISANVPEAKASLVKVNQTCEVRFYGFPGVVYSAHVEELGSVLSTERRTLRVLFDLEDEKNQLRPGMFAEVGLGTDPRTVVLIPANATVHIGHDDYVFKQSSDGEHFELTEVQISESKDDYVEVLSGLKPGERIAGTEAVLLKPLAVQSMSQGSQTP